MQALRAELALIPRDEYPDFLTQAERDGTQFVKLNASGSHVAVAIAQVTPATVQNVQNESVVMTEPFQPGANKKKKKGDTDE